MASNHLDTNKKYDASFIERRVNVEDEKKKF